MINPSYEPFLAKKDAIIDDNFSFPQKGANLKSQIVHCVREKFLERKEEADVEVVTDPELDAECRIDQECVPIRSCEPVLQLLMNVKDEPKDSKWRSHTVNVVRERICGELAQNMICCPRDGFYDQVYNIL